MAEHTPGPWTALPAAMPGFAGQVWAGMEDPTGARMVAVIGAGDTPMEVINANTRLIAAAPDLLAALVRYASRFAALIGDGQNHDDGCTPCEDLRVAQAALAKARGEVQQ